MSWSELVGQIEGLEQFGIEPGLGRIERGLEALGRPDRSYRSIIVAGTNGKGTVASLISSVLQEHGYTVGLYTSPHLLELRERFRVDGRPLSPRRLAPVADRILERYDFRESSGSPPLTFFECTTLVAATAFAHRDVDFGVFEVGLGGRLDAVNVLEPAVGVVTPVGLDHTDVLGSSIDEIAAEKAGIFRTNVPAVIGPQRHELARRRLVEEAERVGADVHLVEGMQGRRGRVRIETNHRAVARRAARLAVDTQWSEPSFRRGVEWWRWPGRLETIQLDGDRRLFVDTAHNAEAVDVLRDVLAGEELSLEAVVWGAMADKEPGDIEGLFAELDSPVWGAEIDGPRARSGPQLAGRVPDRLWRGAGPTERVWREVLEKTDRDVLVFGSVYLVGELYRALGRDVETLRTHTPH